MRILWISSLAWNQGGYKYQVDGPGAVSGSLFQQQMITGLKKLGVDVDIISDYPYAKRDDMKGWSHSINIGSDYCVIPSLSSKYKQLLFKTRWIIDFVRKKCKEKKYDFAIAYLIHTPYMMALKQAKKLGLKTVLICPDLPDMMDMSLGEKKIKKILKKIDMDIQKSIYDYIDGFVLFTKYMTERIPVNNKPYIVIEGVASIQELDVTTVCKEHAIMHAGTLHKNIGIEQIIDAMAYLDIPDLKLWIFGDGELKQYIQDSSKNDSRIRYMGFVDRNELFKYEKKSMALINARNPRDDYTKYSFPSKTFEYLYSGSFFITTKLMGIPVEYDKFLTYIDSNSPVTIAKAIKKVYDDVDYRNIDDVRNFIKNEKTAIPQARRLIALLEKI